MKQWMLHPIQCWREFRFELEEWLTPSAEEIKNLHDRLHALEVSEWYRPEVTGPNSSWWGQPDPHMHSWRCVQCKENIAREVVLVCTECVQAIQSSEDCYELPLPRYHPQEIGT